MNNPKPSDQTFPRKSSKDISKGEVWEGKLVRWELGFSHGLNKFQEFQNSPKIKVPTQSNQQIKNHTKNDHENHRKRKNQRKRMNSGF